MKKVLAFSLAVLMLVMACVPAGALTLSAPEGSEELSVTTAPVETTELAAADELAYPLLDAKYGKLLFLDTFSSTDKKVYDYVDPSIKVNQIFQEGGSGSIAADPKDSTNNVWKMDGTNGYRQFTIRFDEFPVKPGKYYVQNNALAAGTNDVKQAFGRFFYREPLKIDSQS